ncbi:MAG: sigma-70 family RNA polymerase sigma factor [Prevotella sp.]|nr:sigma-70 family RNA polymerase sigma factor [Prevotella sp.]
MTIQNTARPHRPTEKERLVEENMGFVVAMAKEYANKGVAFDDLVSEGYIGLIKAAGKYDGTKGAKFTSYAANYVRQSMMQALGINDCPLNDNASTRLESMASREEETDTMAELAAVSGNLADALNVLNERERTVIAHCYGVGKQLMTFAEIGEEMGLSRERVRQIRKKALRHLRQRNRGQE